MATTPKNLPPKPRAEGSAAAPAALKGEGLEGANVIKLQGAGGGQPLGGGIRTPMKANAGGGRPVAQKGEPGEVAQKPSNATPIEAPRIVSQIRGLNDTGYGIGGTQAGTVMYDSSAGKRKRFILAFVMALVVALAAAAVVYPKQRKRFLNQLSELKEDVIGAVRYKKKKQPRGQEATDEDGQFIVDGDKETRPTRRTPARGPGGIQVKRTCKFLVQQGVGRGVRLTLPEQVDLAECYLAADDLLNAENALSASEAKIQRLSERELNAMKGEGTLADAFHDLMVARLRAGKTREASEMLRGKCNTWAQTNACVAKMMLLADRRVPGGGEGASVMFGSTGRLDNKAQARLWLAGAQLAVADGRPSVADQRYSMALNAAPKLALSLRKQIYEAQALDLYNRGEVVRLKNTTAGGIADLERLAAPTKSLLKLQMFKELSGATQKTRYKTVKSLLTREDITYRARADFELIEVLGPESIRGSVEDDYLRLLKRTRDFYKSKYKTLGLVERRLALWEIRATLSRERFEQALPMIDIYQKMNPTDPVAFHLRGVAYHGMAERGEVASAAAEFQKALRLRRNWESLYALGVTMTRAGKAEQVAPIIKDLDKMITTNGQRYWVEMLKAEWYIEKSKYLNAEKILTTWAEKEPTYVVPRQLLMKLYKRTNKLDQLNAVEEEVVKLARTQRPQTTFEGFASPLGVMALAHRPID